MRLSDKKREAISQAVAAECFAKRKATLHKRGMLIGDNIYLTSIAPRYKDIMPSGYFERCNSIMLQNGESLPLPMERPIPFCPPFGWIGGLRPKKYLPLL